MRREKILAIYDHGTWIGDYRTSDAVDVIGTTKANLINATNNGYHVKHRYSLELVDMSLINTDRELDEFDRVVELIRKLMSRRRKHDTSY